MQFEAWAKEHAEKTREFDDCCRVLVSGMPQATEHEKTSMRARADVLHARIRALKQWMTQAPWRVNKKTGKTEHR